MKRKKLFYILSLVFFCLVCEQGCWHEGHETRTTEPNEPLLHVSTGRCNLYFADHLNTVMPKSGPKNMANALIEAIDFRKQVLAKTRVQEKIDGAKKNKV